MAVVEAVAGNLVTIDVPCPFDLTTNPRIARMPRRRHVWNGGVVGYATGLTLPDGVTDWPTAFVHRGVSDLLINVTMENTPAAAISANGCFKPVVDVIGRNLDNIEGAVRLGYLFNSQGCYFDRANVNAGRNRHAYTTNQSLVAANSLALEEYGGTFGSLVTGQSHGQSQAGFDTHHGSENVTFDSIVSSGGTQGGGQLVLRGLGHRALNPRLSNGRHGILCYTETGVPGDVLSSATVINADVDVDFSPVRTYDPGFAPRGARLTLVGGRYRSRHFGEAFAVAGTLTLEGAVRIRPSGLSSVNTNNKATIAVVDGVVDARQADILIDMQDIPAGATGYDAIESGGATLDQWIGGKIRTINDTGMTRVFSKKSGTTATVQFAPEEMITQKQGGFTVSRTTAGLTGSADVGFTGPWRWTCEGQPERSGYIQADITEGYIVPLLGRGDLEVVARLRATPDPATLGALPNGAFLGQRLTIIAPPFGGSAITILHGTGGNTSFPGAANITLTTTGVTLTWNGGAWERA
jgi:hypothetical protein